MKRAGATKDQSLPSSVRRRLKGKLLGITGIGGFIGIRLAERAEALGMRVRGLEQNGAAARAAEAPGREVSLGDVADRVAVRELCAGCDYLVHLAAIVAEHGEWKEFRRVNVEGARIVAEESARAGVRRLAHFSSVMVYGFHYPPRVAEEGPLSGDGHPYCQTKIESEAAVLESQSQGLEVVIIRPGDVYGPGSIPWVVRILDNLLAGTYAFVDGGRALINHVYIDNLLDGLFLALTHSAAVGQAFNFTDDRRTDWREYMSYFQRWTGRTRIRSIPGWLLRIVLALLWPCYRLVGRHAPAHPGAVRFLQRFEQVSCARAQRVLGYEPRVGLEEGLERTRAWLVARGMLTARDDG